MIWIWEVKPKRLKEHWIKICIQMNKQLKLESNITIFNINLLIFSHSFFCLIFFFFSIHFSWELLFNLIFIFFKEFLQIQNSFSCSLFFFFFSFPIIHHFSSFFFLLTIKMIIIAFFTKQIIFLPHLFKNSSQNWFTCFNNS